MSNLQANLLVANLIICFCSLFALYKHPDTFVWAITFSVSMVCAVWIAVKDQGRK